MDAHPAAKKNNTIAVIITGGDPVAEHVFRQVPADPDLVIAADSGLDHASNAGLAVDVLIGDLDSVSVSSLAEFRTNGGEIITHPADKDDTDLALAVDEAISRGATSIMVLGGAGRRLSHVLGNSAAVAHAAIHGITTTWFANGATIHVATPALSVTLSGRPGDLVSLLPFAGTAGGVSTNGLRWVLDDEDLTADATRGVSNVLEATEARVEVHAGVLLVVHEASDA